MNEMDNRRARQLEMLCKNSTVSFKWVSGLSYWTAEVYGFGLHIRKYGYYPKWLPLCINTDHGPGLRNQPLQSELESTAPVQFYHSSSRVKQWQEISDKPGYCLFSPFVFYRRQYGIHMSAFADGTIAFPAHSTNAIEDVSDLQNYIEELKNLSVEYQPVSVCLHANDIGRGLHKEFIDAGFQVYTAGNVNDDNFTERFYQIIRNFKYSTSNIGGSYLFYCVELGLPFFLYGQEPVYINKQDQNVEKGAYTSYKRQDTYLEMVSLFSTLTTIISDEQRKFVIRGLGIDEGIGRVRLSWVLYTSILKCLLRPNWVFGMVARFRRKWKQTG